jgi:hypothetical protein
MRMQLLQTEHDIALRKKKLEFELVLRHNQYEADAKRNLDNYNLNVTDTEMTQVKQTCDVNVFLTKSQQRTITREEPYLRLRSTGRPVPHPHPILHLERARAETEAISYIMNHCQKKGGVVEIVDVGGNASRHNAAKRSNIHCCNPVLSSSDAMRDFNHGMRHGEITDFRRCEHKAQECTCVTPDVYLSVDQIYYMDAETIAQLVLKSKMNMMIATCHEFPDAYGSFADGEATYHLVDAHTVSMNVRGNSHSYVHSNLGWLHRGGHHFYVNRPVVGTDGIAVVQKVPYTLCWSKVGRQFPWHATYGFTVRPNVHLALDPSVDSPLTSSLQDSHYYGELTMKGIFNEKGEVNTVGEIFDIPDLKIHSWGGFVMVYKSRFNVTMIAPKGLIAEASSFVCGTDRSAERLKALISHLKYKAKALNIPENMKDTTVFAAACLGFVKNSGYETAVLHGVIRDVMPTLEVHRDALNLKFKRIWTWKKVAAAMVTAATIAGGSYAAAHALIPVVAPVVAAAGVAAFGVAGAVATGLAWYNNLPHDPFHNYRVDRSVSPPITRIVPLAAGTRLPSTAPPKSIDDLLATPLDVTARLDSPNPTEIRERLDPLCPYGIVSSMAVPIVPQNSCHSALSADVERSLKPQVFHNPLKFDTAHFDKFQRWVFQHLDELLPGMRKGVKGSSFTAWNNRPIFAKHQREKQLKAYEQWKASGIDDVKQTTVKEMHTKIESLMKAGASDDCRESVEKLAPRAIQGAKTMFNVATAPWIHDFSKKLAACWNVGNADGPVYTSGADNASIGAFVRNAISRNASYAVLEGDFARFDTTVHRRMQALEIAIYEWCGAPPSVLALLRANISTKGGDKWRNKYSVDGTRHSGDPQTSCGNSLLQALCILFSMACHDQARSRSNVLPSPRDLIEKHNVNLLVLGDDNHCVADESFLSSLPIVDYLLRLGLELEPKLHVGPNAVWRSSFCSSRFYPCKNASGEPALVLAPPIGRVAAKAGWFVNPPETVSAQQLVAGDAAGRMNDSRFVPFLRSYWARVAMLTKHVKPAERKLMRDAQRAALYSSKTTELFEASSETWEMVSHVYGLKPDQEKEYEVLLSKVGSIGTVCDYAPLRHAMLVDGVIVDTHSEYKDEAITECPPLMPVRNIDSVKGQYGDVDGICATCMAVGCPGRVPSVSFDGSHGSGKPIPCTHPCFTGMSAAYTVTDDDTAME